MDSQDLSIVEQVLDTVADQSDTEPEALPRLYDALDPEALEVLVGTMRVGEVSFWYAGHEVTVDADGTVELTDNATNSTPVADAAGGASD